MTQKFWMAATWLGVALWVVSANAGGDFQVGVASVEITPPGEVALWGQFHLRVSKTPETPLTANIAALQVGEAKVTLVSLDLLQLSDELVQAVREAVGKKDAGIPQNSIVMAATHTHTAPTLTTGRGIEPSESKEKTPLPGMAGNENLLTVEETISFLADRISDGIVAAWKNLKPGKMTYGLDRNSIGFGRRVVYANGSAAMYGATNREDFRNLEGMDDDDVGTIFFLDAADNLLAILVNVACPSQVVEGRHSINADYWRVVREKLQARYGQSVVILGTCSAAGDISPRPLVQKKANERMRQLRGVDEMAEIARRIELSVSQTWDAVKKAADSQPILKHQKLCVELPLLNFTEAQYQEIKKMYDHFCRLAADEKTAGQAFMGKAWCGFALKRYELLQKNPDAAWGVEVHVVRIGDTVLCTNPFELFTEYGIRMKARSAATQTFVVQLSGFGSYLPTERALQGGGYSAIPQSCFFSPAGGQKLVDETVKAIQEMFP